MSKNKTVKDMLKDGETMDSLIKSLTKEIMEAQAELDKENNEETMLDKVRINFITATVDYLKELGVIKDSISQETLEAAEDAIKEMEPELKKYAKIIEILLDLDADEEKEKPTTYKPRTLTMYDGDIDAKLSSLVKKLF